MALSLLPTAALADEGKVAKVGETEYATLADAVTAAKEAAKTSEIHSARITLLKNTELAAEVKLDGNDSVVNENPLDINIDLNNCTLDMKGFSFTIENGAVLEIFDGQIDSTLKSTTTAAFYVNAESSCLLDNVTMTTTGVAVYARGDCALASVNNSNITAGTYAVTTNAASSDNYNPVFNIVGSTLKGSSPVLVNVPCELNIMNSTINGSMHGVIVRGGTANITGSTITQTYTDDNYQTMADYFNNRNWESGNTINLGALIVGNKHATSYQYPSAVTVTDTVIKTAGAHAESFPAIYTYANNAADKGVNLSIGGDKTNVSGKVIKGNEENNTITISGGTFSSDVSAYVPNGYIQNENGAVETLGETNAVAKIGNTYYKSLVDAYAAMVKMCSSTSEPIVITLLKDSEGGGMGSDKDPALNYVIDFNGHTYTVGAPAVGSTGTVSQGLRVLKGSTAKFMNGTLKAANYNRLVQVVHTYGDVTFQDFTVDATEDAYAWAAVEPDAGTLKVLGNSSILAREGQYGLYAAFWHIDSYNGTTVDVDTTGKITGKLAYEFDEDYTGEKKATENKGFVNIKNGNFDILSIQEIWSDVSDAVDKNVGGIIISGGYFTSDPTAYLAAGKYVIKSDKVGYTYAVTGTKPEKTPIFVDENTTHDTSAITDETTRSAIDAVINMAKVEGVAAAVDESALVASKVDANEVNAAKKVDVEVSVKVEVKSADLSGENAAKTLTFEAKPVATITVTKSDNTTVTKNNVPVPNSLLSGEITVKLPLPAGFTPEQIKHISSDRSVEYFLKTEKRGAKTFEIKDDCAVFKITKFSTFELSGTATYVEPSYYSGSSSYDPTYSVTVDKTENGSVTASPKSASKGDTVTVTVKPDSGYVLETLTVTDKNGNELTLKDKGNGKYTFTMPAGKVEVKATFMEDNSMLNFFYDVPNNAYFYEAVKWAVKNGITTGVGNDLFAPEQPCTRAQIVTFLWRAAGSPEPKGAASGMTDVVSGSYYEKAVAWAIENGITTGTTTSTFSPDATCTRAQAVTFLARALNAKAASAAEFSDVPTGSYFADAVAWAAANGVTEGIGGGLFGSDNDCTRGQIVTFLYRAYNK